MTAETSPEIILTELINSDNPFSYRPSHPLPFFIYHVRSSNDNTIFVAFSPQVTPATVEEVPNMMADWDLVFEFHTPSAEQQKWNTTSRFSTIWGGMDPIINRSPGSAAEAKWRLAITITLDTLVSQMLQHPDTDPEYLRYLAEETFNKGTQWDSK